jgi:hypothetical protein
LTFEGISEVPPSDGGLSESGLSESADAPTSDSLGKLVLTPQPLDNQTTSHESSLEKRHDYALVCSDEIGPSKDWSEICLGTPYQYRCDKAGKMSQKEIYSECHQKCNCHNMNPKPALLGLLVGSIPKPIPPRSESTSGTALNGGDISAKSLQKRHSFALLCDIKGQPNKDWTKFCAQAPDSYRCNGQGQITYSKKHWFCDDICYCHNMNPKPAILSLMVGQMPKPIPPRSQSGHNELGPGLLDADFSSDRSPQKRFTVEKRHNFALVCSLRSGPHRGWTEACQAGPFSYRCNGAGQITVGQQDNLCSRICTCHNMNPRPAILGLLVGSIPKPIPPRSQFEREHGADPGDTALTWSSSIQKRSFVAKRHSFALVCSEKGKANRDWTEICLTSPLQYRCDGQGKLTANQRWVNCEARCACHNMNPAPAILPLIVGSGLKPVGPGSRPRERSAKNEAASGAQIESLQTSHKGKRHNYALVCNEKNQPNRKLTESCLASPYKYTCNGGGIIDYAERTYDCEAKCICHNMNARPAILPLMVGSSQPKPIPPRDVRNGSQMTSDLEKRHSWAFICNDKDGKPDRKLTDECIGVPWSYYCKSDGLRDYRDPLWKCEQTCKCHNMNPKPLMLGLLVGSVPKPIPPRMHLERAEQEAAEEDQVVVGDVLPSPSVEQQVEGSAHRLSKRHNYALVCELDGIRDAEITRSCSALPRYYSCDRYGALTKSKYDSYCDQHCACQNMNPNPMMLGKVAKPCTFCKRDDESNDDTQA